MPITKQGWELHVVRRVIHKSGSKKRTYGDYQVYRDGAALPQLSGHMCECVGPGDNQHAGSGKRIETGEYPLWTQFGRYRTIGYEPSATPPGTPPMPGLLLQATGRRVGILIHPAHPPNLYLSSIGCFNPASELRPQDTVDFADSRARVIALIESLQAFRPDAFAHEVATRISGAQIVVDGEPMREVAPSAPARSFEAALAAPASLPISKSAAQDCTRWLVKNFGNAMRKAARGKPYKLQHLCAIVCQETAYKWFKWMEKSDPQTILARCVFDASGDYPGTSRSAFPTDTAAFRARFGDALTEMLIDEANITRRMQGYADKQWVYKGYGLFQYDLQNIRSDEAFFRQKAWYGFDACLDRACSELDAKIEASGGDFWQGIKAYNGRGPAAEQYMQNVKAFTAICNEVISG